MPEPAKRKTSNGSGNVKDPKKSKQDDPSEEIPRPVAMDTSQPGTSSSNACDYIQIVVTGPEGCGRSSLVCAYMDQLFPPKGSNFLSKQYLKFCPNGLPVMIWDLDAKDERLEYRQKAYQEADVALLCYDVKKSNSLREGFERLANENGAALKISLTKWYNELKTHCKGEKFKVILVGLKRDIKNNRKFPKHYFFTDREINVAVAKFKKVTELAQVSAHANKDEVRALFERAISIAEPQTKEMFSTGGFEIVNPRLNP